MLFRRWKSQETWSQGSDLYSNVTVDGLKFKGSTPTACWNKIYKRILKIQENSDPNQGGHCNKRISSSGSETFGFSNREVMKLIKVHAKCYGELEPVDGVLWLYNLCRPGAPEYSPLCCLCPVRGVYEASYGWTLGSSCLCNQKHVCLISRKWSQLIGSVESVSAQTVLFE